MTQEALAGPLDLPEILSLKELEDALRQRGVDISYSSLSRLLNEGDIATQLQLGGTGSQRVIHREVVRILAGFLPEFWEKKYKLHQAPDLLHERLKKPPPPPSGSLVSANLQTDEQLQARLAAIEGEARGRAEGDVILTATQAAERLHCSVFTLRRNFPPYRRLTETARGDRWRLSDLFQPTGMRVPKHVSDP